MSCEKTCERMKKQCMNLGKTGFRWIQASKKISNLKTIKNYDKIIIEGWKATN